MKRKITAIAGLLIVIFIIIILSDGLAFADDAEQELNDNISSILDGLDLSAIEEYIKNHGNDFIFSFGDSARDIVEYLLHGNLNIDYSSYLGEIFSVLFENVISLVPAFAQIVALSVICAVVKSAEGSIMSKSTTKAVRIACYALIITILIAMLGGVIATAAQSIDNIKAQVEVVTPVLVTLTVLTGGSGAGAIYSPSALFISGGAVEIVSGLIFPATVGIIVINFISKLSPDLSFSGTSKLIKSILKWVIGITLAIFSIFITVQSTGASLFDGIFFKATKYLVGSSVPIVGNFLSAGVDMIVAAGSVIKSSVGMLGIVLLIIEVAPPIILFAAFSLILKFVAAVVQPIGEGTLFSLFSDLAGDIEYFIAGLCTVAFMYALVVMLIISSATNFI
ncbi:MAG TPA: stage III sporulation protein AE [Candidatus Coproplasma avicola]|uniref:Stage III sporulation protein AE n=1 Tax=Candidatus Coproplasma avicola TaxID=2840744 RepID=A0A9D1E675_9FIRM|nr:stage III sporulation protein AE [Candidatus Coproplasma avicola]